MYSYKNIYITYIFKIYKIYKIYWVLKHFVYKQTIILKNVEKLANHLAGEVETKWHAFCHVGTSTWKIGTTWHFGTLSWKTDTSLARRHVNKQTTLAHMTCMACDLANPSSAGTYFLLANKVLYNNYLLEKSMFAGVLKAHKDFATFSGKP